MNKSVRLNSQLESKLRQASVRSGKSEAELLRIGLEKTCDKILASPLLEGEKLKEFAESLLVKIEASASHPVAQSKKGQESEVVRLMDTRESAKRRKIAVSPKENAA